MSTRPSAKQKLVGVVGGAASGKDTVAQIFSQHGYSHISSSDLVREEIAARGLTTSRELQTAVANEMRERNGVGYWVDLSIKKLDEGSEKAVISGLYSPGEGQHLISAYGGFIVSVVAGEGDDTRLRFDRLMARSSGARDDLSYEKFLEAHHRESSGTASHETNLDQLHELAHFVVYNSAGIDLLEEQTANIVSQLEDTLS